MMPDTSCFQFVLPKAATLKVAAFAALVACCFASSSYAQSNQEYSSRLTRIENEISTLSRAVFKGETPPPEAMAAMRESRSSESGETSADFELRLNQLEMELRNLTGQIEQQNFRMRQMGESHAKTVADLELRLSALEARLNGAAIDTSAGTVPDYRRPAAPDSAQRQTPDIQPVETEATEITYESEGPDRNVLGTLKIPQDDASALDIAMPDSVRSQTETDSDTNPQEYYERAFSMLKARNYNMAEESFQSFLNRYPGHKLAENARYWLGETFYVRGNYERAARIFAEGYQNSPQGAKAPDNLLKLGMSLAGMGKTKDACLTFKQIRRQYGNTAEPILNRARAEAEQIDCAL